MPVAVLPAPPRSRRRARPAATRHGGHVSLPFPKPSPGQTIMVGLGDWDSYLNMDQLCAKRGMRVRFHRGIIEVISISFPHESLKGQIGQFVRT